MSCISGNGPKASQSLVGGWTAIEVKRKTLYEEELTWRGSVLKSRNFVHGDVGPQTVLYSAADSIVDFDWAGVVGTVKYSLDVSGTVIMTSSTYSSEVHLVLCHLQVYISKMECCVFNPGLHWIHISVDIEFICRTD